MHRKPFTYFYQLIAANIEEGSQVLEIGSGTGDHSGVILETKAELTVLDISPSSLDLLRLRHPTVNRTVIGNMELLPFLDKEFDSVISCASLSYGNSKLVFDEIYRVLKPGGKVIILDSHSLNLFHHLTRIRYVILRRRSFKTLMNMPNKTLITKFTNTYINANVTYFNPVSNFIFSTHNLSIKKNKVFIKLSRLLESSALRRISNRFVFFGVKQG